MVELALQDAAPETGAQHHRQARGQDRDLAGEEDSPASGRAATVALAELLPRSSLVRFPGLGHMGPVEDPGRINACLERFLHGAAGIPAPAPRPLPRGLGPARAGRLGGYHWGFSGETPMASPAAPPAGSGETTFEKALEELEAIVARMEDGRLPLEESLAAYQRGTELLKYCESRLTDAQARIAILEGDQLRDFPPEDR